MVSDPNYKTVQAVLKRAKQEDKEYLHKVNGIELICHPDVWSPKYSGSGEFALRHVIIPNGSSALDLGTATGYIGIECAKRGAARVLAIDINKKSIDIASRNVRKHNLGEIVEVRFSDVYESVGDERFDSIIWIAPNYPKKPNPEDPLQRSVFDENFETSRRVFTGAEDHLKPNGRLFFECSDNSEVNQLEGLIKIARLRILKRDEESTGSGDGKYTRFLYHLSV